MKQMKKIEIQPYSTQHYDSIKKIILSSFSKTAYHTDEAFTEKEANQFLWERWGRPFFKSKTPKCFSALYGNDVVGFLIYGLFPSFKKVFNLLIGNIVLLGVDTNFQNSSLKIGTKLVEHIIHFFSQSNVSFVTVGTDLDNISAMKIYQKNGFHIYLPWSTYRWHSKNHSSISVEFQKNTDIDFNTLFFPPDSFLEDNFFSDNQKEIMRQNRVKDLKSKLKLGQVSVLATKQGAIFYLTEKISSVSSILIKITAYSGDLSYMLDCLKSHLFTETTDFVIEFFLKSNDWSTIRFLIKNGFFLVHNAVTMHRKL